jgi:hypothetical protein
MPAGALRRRAEPVRLRDAEAVLAPAVARRPSGGLERRDETGETKRAAS